MENAYIVKIAKQAQEQMREIACYIAFNLHTSEAAVRLLNVLEAEIASLSRFPNRIVLTEEEPWRSRGIRKMIVKNYLVYFWVDEATRTVHVTAVVYGGRNQIKQLSEMSMD